MRQRRKMEREVSVTATPCVDTKLYNTMPLREKMAQREWFLKRLLMHVYLVEAPD